MSHNLKQIKINRHPIMWVSNIINSYISAGILSEATSLSFSKYRYIPHSYIDNRINFSLSINQLNNEFLLNELIELNEGEELAFHSEIYSNGIKYHLPLIDFGGKDYRFIESPTRAFSNYWEMDFSIFNSGRSYHAYGHKILTTQNWIKFMGSLLLINSPGSARIIDDRWIGHRLMAEYAALRWSKNSSQYKKFPTYFGHLNSNGLFHHMDIDERKNM